MPLTCRSWSSVHCDLLTKAEDPWNCFTLVRDTWAGFLFVTAETNKSTTSVQDWIKTGSQRIPIDICLCKMDVSTFAGFTFPTCVCWNVWQQRFSPRFPSVSTTFSIVSAAQSWVTSTSVVHRFPSLNEEQRGPCLFFPGGPVDGHHSCLQEWLRK